MDRFPEAFNRFEEVVDVGQIESFRQLSLAFASWADWNWRDTYLQNKALAVKAVRRGIPVFVERRPTGRFHGLTAATWFCREKAIVHAFASVVYDFVLR